MKIFQTSSGEEVSCKRPEWAIFQAGGEAVMGRQVLPLSVDFQTKLAAAPAALVQARESFPGEYGSN
jgi:hypothetical protein